MSNFSRQNSFDNKDISGVPNINHEHTMRKPSQIIHTSFWSHWSVCFFFLAFSSSSFSTWYIQKFSMASGKSRNAVRPHHKTTSAASNSVRINATVTSTDREYAPQVTLRYQGSLWNQLVRCICQLGSSPAILWHYLIFSHQINLQRIMTPLSQYE